MNHLGRGYAAARFNDFLICGKRVVPELYPVPANRQRGPVAYASVRPAFRHGSESSPHCPPSPPRVLLPFSHCPLRWMHRPISRRHVTERRQHRPLCRQHVAEQQPHRPISRKHCPLRRKHGSESAKCWVFSENHPLAMGLDGLAGRLRVILIGRIYG